LKYVQQQGLTEIEATVFKENMVRADDIPLVLMVVGAKDLPRGARVRVKLGDIDEVMLDIGGTVVARLDTPAQDLAGPEEAEAEDEDDAAGPIAIAVDMSEEPAPANPASSEPVAP
jgi:exoribonuclease-2